MKTYTFVSISTPILKHQIPIPAFLARSRTELVDYLCPLAPCTCAGGIYDAVSFVAEGCAFFLEGLEVACFCGYEGEEEREEGDGE